VKRSINAVVVSLLLLLPLVAGATLNCPSKAPADKVVCRLEGNGTGKLYLKSVDGIPRAQIPPRFRVCGLPRHPPLCGVHYPEKVLQALHGGKERLIAEIEERVAKIEEAGR